MRRLALAVCLLALPAGACGGGEGNDREQAQAAAEAYVTKLGQRDGPGACDQMTRHLQAQFVEVVTRTDARFRGSSCRTIMQAAVDQIPPSQLRQFARSKIEGLKLDGNRGTFRYTLGSIRVDGRVEKEKGDWKVSCCVPGAGG
jgi:hypothetical protein